MDFRFGAFALYIARRELRRDGALVSVEPQVFDLIAYLVARRERMVSKDELLDAVWQGRFVSESSLTTRINAARRALGDSGETQTVIRTVPRKGFRFIAEVSDAAPVPAAAKPSAPEPVPEPRTAPAEAPRKATLAVLPFATMGSAADDTMLAEGLASDLATALTRFRLVGLVPPPPDAGEAFDPPQLAARCGANYLLYGSLRSAGGQLRANVQLYDARAGQQLWAERFDRRPTDLFAVQDELCQAIVAGVEQPLVAAENRRGAPDATGETSDVMKAAGWLLFRFDEAANDRAIALLEQAIIENPSGSRRHQALSMGHCWRLAFGWTPDPQATAAAAIAAAEAALRLDDDDAWNHCMLGWSATYAGQRERGLRALERAVSINPNSAVTHGVQAWTRGYCGEAEGAIAAFEQTRRLAGQHPFIFMHATGAGWGHFARGDLAEAVEHGQTATLRRPNCIAPLLLLTAAQAEAGEMDAAAAAVAQLHAIAPPGVMARLPDYLFLTPGPLRTRAEAALRLAGLAI